MASFTELHDLSAATRAGRTSVVALVSSFNRRVTTLRGLSTLARAVGPGVSLSLVLFDDGSSDGTAEAVQLAHPEATVIRGGGDLYWSASMAAAQEHALTVTHPDHLLWFNDDVELLPDALETLLATARQVGGDAVVVGAMGDPGSRAVTYSGYRRTGRRPLSLAVLPPSSSPQRISTFNGNAVLVPRAVYEVVGSVDRRYEHAYGDVDYGYRVAAAGYSSWLAPRLIGVCSRNASTGTWLDADVGVAKRTAMLFGRKGMPLRSHYRFFRRHGGRPWMVFLGGSYVVNLVRILRSSLARRIRGSAAMGSVVQSARKEE